MAQVNLGRIGFVNKGSWNSVTNYKLNDVVKYGGSTYAAKRPNEGITPPTNGTDTDDWFYFVNNSDYVDKTSDQDITGIKNFTNGITATEITATEIKGDKTIDGETTFVVSPKVPEPTDSNDAVNKAYLDENVNINSFPEKTIPSDTDNLALQETGGLLKKLSFANLKESLKNIFLTKPELVTTTGTATFNGTTQNINLTNIGNITLAVGDVIEVTGTTSNNKLFTVESIVNNNNIVVNYEHRGTSTPAPSKRLINETASNCTINLYNRAKNAPLGQGQGWVIKPGVQGVYETNNTGRNIQVFFDLSSGDVEVDGIIVTNGAYAFTGVIPPGSKYRAISGYDKKSELR